jgi:hypothetical protein
MIYVSYKYVVRDSSAVRRHYYFLLEPWDVRELYIRKTVDFPSNSGSAHFHVSWLFDFIFYQKPLYKSLPQSFFYSFITILPSESGVTLHYSTIFPWTLWFRHFTSILEHLPRDFEKTTITAMYHGRWFAYKQTNKHFYCQS